MNAKKLLIPVIFLLLSSPLLLAQQRNDYAKNWKTVDAFEKKGLTASALKEVTRIFDLAVASGNEVQQVKAAMYQMKYRNLVEEDNRENNIFYLDTLIRKAKAPARNILQNMQAGLFWSYIQNNRYRLYNRTNVKEETGNDIRTWSVEKLNQSVLTLFSSSLKNETLLKNTSLEGMDAILEKGINTRYLRPTLYDLLAHRALSVFMSDEPDISRPSYNFILNDERIFSPAATFCNAKFITRDTVSHFYHALIILQGIIKFHISDTKPDALLDADLLRLRFAYEHGVSENKDRLYENALLKLETSYDKNAAAAQAMYLRAKLYYEQGSRYDRLYRKDNQYEIKRARELCELSIARFPGSEGAINCRQLLNQVITPSLNLETELVNIPGKPFRSLVKYKNINTLYFRIIKTDRDKVKQIVEQGYNDNLKTVLSLKPLKTWDLKLPDLQDHQLHATEIRNEPLEPGIYIILSSIDPEFSLTQNIIARQVIRVSNISYISNNKDELYILDRNNGSPLASAEVQLWSQKYDYNNRKNEAVKTERYVADEKGFIKLSRHKGNYNNAIQVKYKNDELFLDDNVAAYYYNSYEKKPVKKTFLFTDRSIYRPGQTVYFKGITVQTDSTGRKSEVVQGLKTMLLLHDANGQKISSLQTVTNDYGSYSGNFKIPEGLLNGQFHIRDTVTNSSLYFSVEEYKRPKYAVEILKPLGSYRLNDSITVTGNAKAFAGNNIDGAKVSYRVQRKVQYPIWRSRGNYYDYDRPYYPNSGGSAEITNGETTTGANGEFSITFKAIPDETADRKDQPVFHYEVNAEITDNNGETRSGSTTIAVSYQALQLDIIAKERMEADSIRNIRIVTKNMNGLFEKASVNVSLFKVKTITKLFRKRYWELPDLFNMSREAWYADFPHDPYADEDELEKWPLGEKLIDKTDSSRENTGWQISNGQLQTGWYKLVAVTKDKYGEEARAEKFIHLTDGRGLSTENLDKITLSLKNEPAEPGENISYDITTAYDSIWLIHGYSRNEKTYKSNYYDIKRGSPFSDLLPVSESDRGGIYLNYAFVKHNRVYNSSRFINVPWSNKELTISYETFRDKTMPGSEEKWKIKISGSKKEKVAAEALLSMYDASLDQFKAHQWNSMASLWPANRDYISWHTGGFNAVNSEEFYRINYPELQQKPKSYDALANNGWDEGGGILWGTFDRGVSVAMAAPNMEMGNNRLEEVVVTEGRAQKSAGIKVKGQDEMPVSDSTGKALTTRKESSGGEENISIRKNFNETAFFYPALNTDANGDISFSFTIPEALTKWKMITMAHTKELASGYSEKTMITQKPLMVQPNAPRFIRQGDQMEFSTKIANLENRELTGTVQLELFDAGNNKPVDGWFKNIFPNQYFTVEAGKSTSVKFPISIPEQFSNVLTWRIKAITQDKSYSDGEESAVPVLSNRMLVTESMPLNMRNTETKNFKFEKLLGSGGSETISNHKLTVEYSSNPAWYAVQSLPYLMEFPYECAEQQFNRYYANTLASFIANTVPGLQKVFQSWKNIDSAALQSNLQKNEELKAVLLQETPWVLESTDENTQKKNIALLFDLARMQKEKNSIFGKLKEMQSNNGGFCWFKGGPDDRYITQYIITGIGHLRKLHALQDDDIKKLKQILDKAVPYLDARTREDYDYLARYGNNLKQNNLTPAAIQYLYMRSFFPEYKVANSNIKAYNYYRDQSKKYWLSNSRYMQAMIALSLFRTGDIKTPEAIIRSLKENAIYKEETGMYWKDLASGGYYWYQAPIESQAMMIEAFSDIDKDTRTIDDLKTWLLKQKQTQNWKTTRATAEACYALLLNGSNWLAEQKEVNIKLGNTSITSSGNITEAGTGYFKQAIAGEKVDPSMGNITVTVKKAGNDHAGTSSTSWGAVYWQYFENLDKISAASTPLRLSKKLFIEKNSDRGPQLIALKEGDELHVGDKVKVRIELRADRDMEYIHMKDMRAACMEPVNVISSYKWQGGLGYYETTKDASTNFFFGWLPRGTYVFEYLMHVTHKGNFSNGITSIQCMYAPEFSSHSEGLRVTVE